MLRLSMPAVVLIAQAFAAGTAAAQTATDPTRGEPTGVRESARTLDVQRIRDAIVSARRETAEPATRKPDVFLLLPSLALADGVNVAGASGAYVSNAIAGHPIQVRGGYRRLDLDAAPGRDQVSLDGKVPLINDAATRLTPYAEIKRVLDTSRRARIGATFEQTFAEKVTLGGSLEYASSKRDDADDSVEDLIPGLGISYAWSGTTETGVDYTFKNDLDGEYDVSFTLSQRLTPETGPSVSLVFGVARHRTVFITLVKPFSLGSGTARRAARLLQETGHR